MGDEVPTQAGVDAVDGSDCGADEASFGEGQEVGEGAVEVGVGSYGGEES